MVKDVYDAGVIHMPVRVNSGWRLDRSINAALIVAILIQAGASIWYLGTLSERVNNMEIQTKIISTVDEKVVRLETRLDSIADALVDIKALLRTQGKDPLLRKP